MPQARSDVPGGYASDSVILRLAPEALPPAKTPVAAAKTGTVTRRVWEGAPPPTFNRALRNTWKKWGVTRMEPAIRTLPKNLAAAKRYGLDRYYVLHVPAGTDTPALTAELAAAGAQVEQVSLNAIGTLSGLVPGQTQLLPDDDRFCDQYDMHNTGQDCMGAAGTPDADIDAPEAWALHTGTPGSVTVAIVDSGVMPHIEFRDRILPTGFNAVDPTDPDLTDAACPHGTHVAGIVAAAGNNGFGIAGVNWNVSILRVKAFSGCFGFEDDAADGIIWAVDHGADIINMSFQFCDSSLPLLESAVAFAADNGVLLVAAAGNDHLCGFGTVAAPARFPEVIAVSGTTEDDRIANPNTVVNLRWSSNFGPEIELCAPGDFVLSTLNSPTTYARLSGTSMAAPHVSGVASLVKSFVPQLTAGDIRQILRDSADDLTWNPNGGPPLVGRDDYYGYGRVNAFQALRFAGPQRIVSSSPADGSIDGRQPSEPDGSNPDGWTTFRLFFLGGGGLVSTVAPTDLLVEENGSVASPGIQFLIPDDTTGTLTVVLDRPITPGTWTTITHVPSNTSATFGFLPGDLTGDGVSNEADVQHLVDTLATTSPPPADLDVDRSGTVGPQDILRLIDLLNGADAYPVWFGATLP